KSSLDIPLVALQDGLIAGIAWGKIEIEKPQIANLYQMWVSPSYRGKGIGLALLTKFKEWAIQSDARSLRLDVTVNNGRAHHLYNSFGFVNSGALKPLREGSSTRMQKMLLALKNA
ncbi:MAG: GNAT family N-acetyltransferase, partial [Amphritea sp.]|nr:GNAT family N-acetyltransferase [Amphritea sp.]